jgi:hypothetical protein
VLEPMRKSYPQVPEEGGGGLKIVVAAIQKRGPAPRPTGDRWSLADLAVQLLVGDQQLPTGRGTGPLCRQFFQKNLFKK